MNKFILNKSLILAMALALPFAGAAMAQSSSATPKVYGYFQFLATIHEENANNPNADSASTASGSLAGFQERRARIGAKGAIADGFAGYNLLTEWAANTPAVVDFWGSVRPADSAEIIFGRFKPYLSAEMFSSGADLPNLERSPVGRLIAGYMFPLGSTRDLGVMAKFALPGKFGSLYLSATNGLGSGPKAQVGGMAINKRNIRENGANGGMICAGLALAPMEGLALSLAGTVNKTGAITDADGKETRIDRSSQAFGVKYASASLGWLDAEYTAARRESADGEGKDEMSGYYARAGVWLMADRLDLIFRHSSMEQGTAQKKRDSDYSAALRYRRDGFETLVEYIKTDGDAGSMYGAQDPWALAVRLGVRF